ncbi:histidine phosphatase superfamily [Aspergillus caelatus]|uniref:Histidine phosphatase superfamily n=1 Tax=Aspergillus caelatus TaxID=61420 RepID=A0A5N7A9Y9_9EURO|nr:histidine phosphatase superfamily [Aspergillus caelatus]KAE8365410.1 histidine phosphatase superfamily [Aspergillus caelatus]
MRPSFQPTSLLLALTAMDLASAERVLGAYIFARHGDRTPKVLGNTRLTDLGYSEVYQAGSYYHDRYIDASSSLQIDGISSNIVNLKQLTASSPSDAVLQNSGVAFMQGVYPPVGSSANETLANGTTVSAPLGGYQLIPLSLVSTGTNSEDNTWLQDATGCNNAKVSSNSYYSSTLYNDLYDSTEDFYQSLSSMLDGAFAKDKMSFKNAYTIYDYLNVANIHNTTNTPTTEQLEQLFLLANIEQYNLAYNTSDTVRAIAGSQLAGEMLQGLNKTITSKGANKLNIQFGSYGTFLSYFGLAQLPAADVNFTGIPDYASSMSWELITDSTADGFPDASEINVRFIFHNGTITGSNDAPKEFPLYGQSSATIPWSKFVEETKKIAVTDTEEWCKVCGNTDGKCASYNSDGSGSDSAGATSKSGGDGVSRPVAGVIGAMVTLAVIFGLEALFLLAGGFTITKKRRAGADGVTSVVAENKA